MPTPRVCSLCCNELLYSDQWDSKYCPVCNEWKEAKCCKPEDNAKRIECWFECWNRPKRPLDE